MKIVFLSFYSGLVARGAETFVHELANNLVGLGHEATVFQSGPTLNNSKYQSITIKEPIDLNHKSGSIPFLSYFPWKVRRFTKLALKQIDPRTDIIVPTNGQWQSLLCKIWSIQNRKKMVISGQSGPGKDDRINLWTFPDFFITLTNWQQDWAKKANPFVKILKIPNGVDLETFNLQNTPTNINLPKPIILCVAALTLEKRNHLIIEAVSKINQGSLLLVGNGPEEEKLKTLGQNLLPSRFKNISLSHDKMPQIFRTADLFTFATSPWESFGIVLLEAMASGLPVVASDDPIRREIVGQAGLFVDPENVDEYTRTLKQALDKNWGNLPRMQAEEFSWKMIAKEYDHLFKSLLKK